MKEFIHKKLNEALTEVNFLGHSIDRIKERFNVFTDDDISNMVKQEIMDNINILETINFSPNKSYGVMLGSFKPNPNSQYYIEVEKGRGYYKILSDDIFIKDSTGDQFWVIIRDNKATTFMLRKAIQTNDVKHNLDKLGVDYIIKNLPEYIRKQQTNSTNKTNKFKKIKLTNGSEIKYYKDTNKFEDLQGNELNIDSIFNQLDANTQEMVFANIGESIKLSESTIIDEDYPSNFDMDKFKSLNSFSDRIKYCEQNLERISSGSSRIVYNIDDTKVLKLAKNKKGLAQNEVEIEWGKSDYFSNILAKVFDSDENNLWVEMQLVEPVDDDDFVRETGFRLQDIFTYLRFFDFNHIRHDARTAESFLRQLDNQMVLDMNESDFISSICDYMVNTDAPAGDFGRRSSYGKTSDGSIVIIDYGFSGKVSSTYYSR